METYTREDIYHFVESQHLATVATVDASGQPQAATVFCIMSKAGDLFFPTRTGSRKYTNILTNPSVALVLTDTVDPITFQIHGTAKEVTDEAELAQVITEFMKSSTHGTTGYQRWLPPVKRLNEGHFTYIKVTPTWVRVSDFREEEHAGEGCVQEIPLN